METEQTLDTGLGAVTVGAADFVRGVDAPAQPCPKRPLRELACGLDPAQRLDGYVPDRPRSDGRALLVLVPYHGEAGVRGNRSWLKFVAPAVTCVPAISAASTHQLPPAARSPAQCTDVCDRIQGARCTWH